MAHRECCPVALPLKFYITSSSSAVLVPQHQANNDESSLPGLLICHLRLTERVRMKTTLSEENIYKGARLRSLKIPRKALQYPSICGSGSDMALVTLTGLDHLDFRYLLIVCTDAYEHYSSCSKDVHIRLHSHQKRGKPRSGTDAQCLALSLARGPTRGSRMVLWLMFRISDTIRSLLIRFGRPVL